MDAGYDPDNFISKVPSSLVCGICKHVVREPRLCKDGEHCFCFSCISLHLNESQTCPVSRAHLTAETLVAPQACFKRVWRELQIKCDYVQRGCSGPIQLGNLEDHVGHCGFAPVTCEKCGMQLNRKDKDNHEKSFCQLGGANCRECGDIKASQDQMKQELCQMKATQGEIKEIQNEMKDRQDVTVKQLDEIINDQREHLPSVKENMDVLKRKHDKMEDDFDEIKTAQAAIKANQERFEAEVRNQFLGVKKILGQLLSIGNTNNNGAQVRDGGIPEVDRDIILVGGRFEKENDEVLSTVEKFNMATGMSTDLPNMKQRRAQSASCIHNDDLVVIGGSNGDEGIDTMEVLKINQHPFEWTMLDAKLPVKLSCHVVALYQNKAYVIGGFNHNENGNRISDAIYEVTLSLPVTTKLFKNMPEPRRNHGAEIVNNKLFIFGGRKKGVGKDAMDSVVVYDFTTNEFDLCPPLPKALCKMATVTWENTVILIGGKDVNGKILNDVIQYDTQTGKSVPLPPLMHNRRGCSAVISDDVIVVLGGHDKERCLNSVETLKIGSDRWKELGEIKERRNYATAVVLPRI